MMPYDYDLIVLGGGAAGLTGAGLGVSLGAKTLMVESERLGGDCTWYGCVPSKTLLKAAKAAHTIRDAGSYGLIDSEPKIDFAVVMSHLREIRDEVYHDADRPEIYEELGVEVVFGEASFEDPHTIKIASSDGERVVSSRYILIGTGAKAYVPPIPGLDAVDYHTNETLFEIDELPKRLAIVGAGPIGCEMAQAFSRLGSKVTVIDRNSRVLPRDHESVAVILQKQLVKDGIDLIFNGHVKQFSKGQAGIVITVDANGVESEVVADRVLLATGRRANIKNLNLKAAGVKFDLGITVNDRCRTNVRHIFASGDVTGRYQFTHMSEHMSKIAITNALAKFPMKIDSKHVPWVTFTDPEIAHVGASEKDLLKSGKSYVTYRLPYSKIDRAVTDSESDGLIQVYGTKSGKILGVDIAGASAGELVSEFALAMKNGVSLRKIADTIHPYPTYGLGVRRLADQWYVKNHTTIFARLLKFFFRYRGPVIEFGPDQIV